MCHLHPCKEQRPGLNPSQADAKVHTSHQKDEKEQTELLPDLSKRGRGQDKTVIRSKWHMPGLQQAISLLGALWFSSSGFSAGHMKRHQQSQAGRGSPLLRSPFPTLGPHPSVKR